MFYKTSHSVLGSAGAAVLSIACQGTPAILGEGFDRLQSDVSADNQPESNGMPVNDTNPPEGMNPDPSDPGMNPGGSDVGMNPVPVEMCTAMFEDCVSSGRNGGECEEERAACLMGSPIGGSSSTGGMNPDPNDPGMNPVPVEMCHVMFDVCLSSGRDEGECEAEQASCLLGVPVGEFGNMGGMNPDPSDPGMNPDPNDPGMNPVPVEMCHVMFDVCLSAGRDEGECEAEQASCLLGVPVGEPGDSDDPPTPTSCGPLLEECLLAGVDPAVCDMAHSACLIDIDG